MAIKIFSLSHKPAGNGSQQSHLKEMFIEHTLLIDILGWEIRRTLIIRVAIRPTSLMIKRISDITGNHLNINIYIEI